MPSTSCPIRLAPETHDMENAALSWSGPSLAWPDLQNVKISCGSMEADTEVCTLLFDQETLVTYRSYCLIDI